MAKPFDPNPGTGMHFRQGDLLQKIRKGRNGQKWLSRGQNMPDRKCLFRFSVRNVECIVRNEGLPPPISTGLGGSSRFRKTGAPHGSSPLWAGGKGMVEAMRIPPVPRGIGRAAQCRTEERLRSRNYGKIPKEAREYHVSTGMRRSWAADVLRLNIDHGVQKIMGYSKNNL
jgi:hypothetical protein